MNEKNRAMYLKHIEALKTKDAAGREMTSLQTKILNRAKAGNDPVLNEGKTFLAAFRCSCCNSFNRERMLVRYKEDFKAAVVSKTIRCSGCEGKARGQEKNSGCESGKTLAEGMKILSKVPGYGHIVVKAVLGDNIKDLPDQVLVMMADGTPMGRAIEKHAKGEHPGHFGYRKLVHKGDEFSVIINTD